MVQDFDWIKPSPSPNWGVVDPPPFEERLVQLVDIDILIDHNDVESVLRGVL